MSNEQKKGEGQTPEAQQPKTPKPATPRTPPVVSVRTTSGDPDGEPQQEKRYRRTDPDLEACVAKAEAQIRESGRQLGE